MKTIFLSSTFLDMHFERDLIHERIAPAINAQAAAAGDHVSFCDLRWGIDTLELDEEESSRKVLRVCLDEIDRCRPYMMIIIGCRYGWIPGEDLIRYGIRGRNLELEDLERSVTELEIRYGALSREGDLDHVFIYFRNIAGIAPSEYGAEDAEHLAKLESLKARLWSVAGSRIREYTVTWDQESGSFKSKDEFEKLVKQDLLEAFEPEWHRFNAMSPMERQLRIQLSYAEQKEYPQSSRDKLAREFLEEARSNYFLALSGPSGCGKTSLLSRMVLMLKDEGKEVLPMFSGISKECNDARDLLRLSCAFLEDKMGIGKTADSDSSDVMELRYHLITLAARYDETVSKELYIVIDALDQLFPDEARDSLLFMIPYPSDKIHYIVSFVDSFSFNRPAVQKVIPMPDMAEREQMIRGILSVNRREVDNHVLNAILSKKSLCSPLYAGFLMQRLQMLSREDFEEIQARGGMESISDHQRKIIEDFPDEIGAGAKELISTAAQQVGGVSVWKALSLLAFSRHGLRQEDLFAIMEREKEAFSSLDFSLFVQFLSDFFLIRDDGRYDLTHAKLREYITEGVLPEEFYRILFRHFTELDDADPVKLQEIGFFAIRAGEVDLLKERCVRSTGDAKGNLAVDLHEQCMLDEGRFLAGILESEEVGSAFWDFCVWMLQEQFGQSRQETEIRRRLIIYMNVRLQEAHKAAEKNGDGLADALCDAVPGAGINDWAARKATMYSEIPEMLGDCYIILSGREQHEKAEQCFDVARRQLEIGMQKASEDSKRDLAYRKIRLLAKSAENDVQIRNHEKAYQEAMEGVALSEQWNFKEFFPKLYHQAAYALYYTGVQKKYIDRKPFFGKRKGDEEIHKAIETIAKGKSVCDEMYRLGELTERGILQYAEILKLYGDSLELLQGKENFERANQLYQEGALLCDHIGNPWDLKNAGTIYHM